jgi:hypothetical protein
MMPRAFLLHLAPSLGARLLRDAGVVYETITTARGDDRLDLGDSWAGLHFLLSVGETPMPRHIALARGLSWDDHSLENLLMGGELTPYEDAFSGARYLAPPAIAALAQQVASLTPDQLSARFDDEIYDVLPAHWADRPDTRAELLQQFERLVTFYQSAARANHGILLYMV